MEATIKHFKSKWRTWANPNFRSFFSVCEATDAKLWFWIGGGEMVDWQQKGALPWIFPSGRQEMRRNKKKWEEKEYLDEKLPHAFGSSFICLNQEEVCTSMFYLSVFPVENPNMQDSLTIDEYHLHFFVV